MFQCEPVLNVRTFLLSDKTLFTCPWDDDGNAEFFLPWEHKDSPAVPGMRPIRKEMEGTQDVLITVSHSTLRARLLEESFTGIFSTPAAPLFIKTPL